MVMWCQQPSSGNPIQENFQTNVADTAESVLGHDLPEIKPKKDEISITAIR